MQDPTQTTQTIKQSINLILTLKVWPIVALATIGLCFLTQTIAKWFGIDLPDQANIDIVRRVLTRMFETPRAFLAATLIVGQVIFLLPAIEELVFRYLLFKLPGRIRPDGTRFAVALAAFSSVLFSAAHYIAQPWPDAAFIALFFFGLAQCWLYRKSGRLWCAILNHALFNLTNLILLFIIPQG